MRKKVTLSFTLLFCLSFFVLAIGASAHVVVYPSEATQGSYEKFTVRVPTEKESPTMKVEVQIPDGVNISRFEPKPDWTYEIAKDESGKIVAVTWSATGAGLSATEFGEFNMQGKIADDADDLVWKAYQTYADGEVVEWTGASDADKPASVTTVKERAAAASSTITDTTGDDSNVSTALYIAIAAGVLSLIALLVALMNRNKPAG